MSKILNPSQARAICTALDALNQVSSARGIELSFVGSTNPQSEDPMQRVTYAENAAGEVVVFSGPAMSRNVRRENYPGQTAFATSYSLAQAPGQAVCLRGLAALVGSEQC